MKICVRNAWASMALILEIGLNALFANAGFMMAVSDIPHFSEYNSALLKIRVFFLNFMFFLFFENVWVISMDFLLNIAEKCI